MPEQPDSPEMMLHKANARNSFRYWFQACVKIPIKDKSGEDAGLIFPRMNVLQDRIEMSIEQQQRDGAPIRTITGKFRQGGSSRYHMNRCYWMGRNRPLQIGVIADDKNTTPRMLDMWSIAGKEDRFGHLWGNKPACAGFARKYTHGTALFEETANDPRAGQGGTLDILISTETAHYKSKGQSTGEAVFQSIANTVPDLPGTWIALESTANGKQGVYFKTYQESVSLAEWINGMRGNGFIKSFAAWFEADDYQDKISPQQRMDIMDSITDEESRLITKYGPAKITPERIAWRRRMLSSPKISGDRQKMEQEYPSSEEDMFISTGTQVFDTEGIDRLDRILNERRPEWGALEDRVWQRSDHLTGWLRIWEHPKEGCSYLVSMDFAEGENSDGTRDPDCHSVSVWRDAYMTPDGQMQRIAKVASIKPECRVNIDVVCKWGAEMARYYGDCIVVPEVNSAFGIVELLAVHGVYNIYKREQSKEERRVGEGRHTKKRGWKTTEQSREQIVSNMQRLIREELIDAWCPRFLSELKAFVTKENGRKEAGPGAHDDQVLESCIGLQCIPMATRYQTHTPVVDRPAWDHQPEGYRQQWPAGNAVMG